MTPFVFLLLATLFWAGNFLVGETAAGSMSPLELTFWRWTLAAGPLLLLASVIDRPDWRAALRQWRLLLLLSALGMSAYTLFLYAALGQTSALNAALITAANPALIVLLALVLFGQRPDGRAWAGLVLGLAGVLLVLTGGNPAGLLALRFNSGDLLMLASILVWGFYTILSRRVGIPAITSTALQAVLAVLCLLPAAVLTGAGLPEDGAGALSLAYIAVFPSVGSYLLWNLALRKVPPSTAGNFLNMIAVFTAVITVLLGRAVSGAQVLGGALVIGGVLLTSLRRAAPAAPAAAPSAPEPATGHPGRATARFPEGTG